MELLGRFLVGFVAILGAVVGSFLNVVIYRLPRGLSVARPRRSFCPHCGYSISARDNVPVLSWLALGGRCRNCRAPISIVYPVIELLAALVFVMIWDALFVGRVIRPIWNPVYDWPAAIGFLTLGAGLLASSVMDVEEYLIDVRVTYFVALVGVICRAVWGATEPVAVGAGYGPGATLVGAAMLAGFALSVVFDRFRTEGGASPRGAGGDALPADEAGGAATAAAVVASAPPRWPVVALLVFVLVCVLAVMTDLGRPVWMALQATHERALAGFFVLMVVMLLAAMVPRPADMAMETAIDEERPQARRLVLGELASMLPSIVLGGAVFGWMYWHGRLGMTWVSGMGPRWTGVVAAGGSAIAGMMFSAAFGWFVRIFFTLAFGKEAFGVGDIHIMAAIGAVGGLGLTVIAFFLGAVLALVGVVVTSLKKRSRTLQFGPWLSLGTIAGLWVYDPIMSYMAGFWSNVQLMLGWTGI